MGKLIIGKLFIVKHSWNNNDWNPAWDHFECSAWNIQMVITIGVFGVGKCCKFLQIGHFMQNLVGNQQQGGIGAKTAVCCTKTAHETPQQENKVKIVASGQKHCLAFES